MHELEDKGSLQIHLKELLEEYSNEEFDVTKAMMMALIHDIVEIERFDRGIVI